ncbi:MAG TPA: nucleoside diphosphate kinase regulator [Burkholderiales bacterium]|nr:nucleoside diphosphate kinase regulator [Burkholderiales bacterium]
MKKPHLFLTEPDFVRLMALQADAPLWAELERAMVVAPDAIPSNVITMNSHVRYRDEHADVSRQIQIVYPEEADFEQGKVSVLAPVGAALLGLQVGQVIDWNFPGGETRRLRVEEVIYQPETAAREQAARRSSGDSTMVASAA